MSNPMTEDEKLMVEEIVLLRNQRELMRTEIDGLKKSLEKARQGMLAFGLNTDEIDNALFKAEMFEQRLAA